MYIAYNIVIYLYYAAVWVVQLFDKKVRTMWKGEQAAFSYLKANVDPDAEYVWFHAASLGEFEQGRPLMEEFRRCFPKYKILLTFFSPSGYEVQKGYDGADLICYLPIDTPYLAHKFLKTIRPVMAFFIKYDFWYNYLHILKHRNIPTYSVSSIFRDGQIFFRWYGKGYAKVLSFFTHLYVQNEKSRDLLATIGITNVSIVGDTRFDRVLQIKKQAKKLPLIEEFIGNRDKSVMVVGSSWPGDEEVIFPFSEKLIIAPHNVNEGRIRNILSKCKDKKVARYTEISQNKPLGFALADADVLIIDCYGLLSSIYGYGDVTYVGGGFDPTGIHNVLEAAVWNKPVIYGPDYQEYQEAIGLKDSGGGLVVNNKTEFTQVINKLFTDNEYLAETAKKSGAYVKSQTGATDQILSDLGFHSSFESESSGS